MVFPSFLLRSLVWLGLAPKPQFKYVQVDDQPDLLVPGIIYHEVRAGHSKWVHFSCPKCAEHIQVPLAGSQSWTLHRDLLGRPSIAPSIWQTGSCQAHFFVRKGLVDWV
jgi:hypothetical protein